VIEILVVILVVLALIFSILGVVGLFRFPDIYTRMHAAGLVGSLGLLFSGTSVLLYAYILYAAGGTAWLNFGAHVILALIVVFFTATTSTHAIARSAYQSGNTSKVHVIDALEEDKSKMMILGDAQK
jgi:multicomponent Na+:H+ antiporter subunit G